MEHDDGQLPPDIEEADVILIGISRTSKTPTSIYLANRGIKTVNVPIVIGVPIPDVLVKSERPLIVGLVASAERISQVRQHRVLGATLSFDADHYLDRANIIEELTYARQICHRHNWPMIDVSRRSIEETAAAVLALRSQGTVTHRWSTGRTNKTMDIILASKSPFRATLLKNAGIAFTAFSRLTSMNEPWKRPL